MRTPIFSRTTQAIFYTCVLSLICQTAFAQEEAAAEALFRSAREAAEKGDWKTACDRFEESHRLEPAAGTVLNLARCREELGQVASAWKRYGEVVQRLPPTDSRVDYARKKEAILEPLVPRLTILPPAQDAEYAAVVDGLALSDASFGVPLPFDPGPVVIEVRAPDRKTWKTTIDLQSGDQVEQMLQLGPVLENSASEVVTNEPPNVDHAGAGSRSTWGYTAVGVGTAGAMAGAVGAIWSVVELNTVNQHCLEDNSCSKLGFDAGQRGQSAIVMMAAGFGVGAVGLGLGLYLLGSRPPKTEVGFVPLDGGGLLSVQGNL